MHRLASLVSLVFLAACGASSVTLDGGTDSSLLDTGPAPDSGPPDSGPLDAGPAPLYPPGAIGAPCERDDACDDGLCVRHAYWPGGQCTSRCETDVDCTGDSFCQPLFGICVPSCTPGASGACRPGYACAPNASFDGRAGCMVGCYADEDCRSGSVCLGEGTERIPSLCHRPDAAIGAACEVADECDATTCASEEDDGWPGGACAGASACEGGVRNPGSVSFACLAACSGNADCRGGYRCAELAEGRACVPGCETDADCTIEGRRCVPSLGTCMAPLVPEQVGRGCSNEDPATCIGGWCARTSEEHSALTCLVAGCRLRGTGPSRDCPSDTACVEPWAATRAARPELFDPDIGVCMRACSDASECPLGTDCTDGYCRF